MYKIVNAVYTVVRTVKESSGMKGEKEKMTAPMDEGI